jgi:hypothetical protein
VSRKDDLEQSIREPHDIIRKYETIGRTSGLLGDKLRAQYDTDEQRMLVKGV